MWATGCSQGALVRSEASGGTHDGSESDLAGGNEDKEAGTPHPPLLDLSSARTSQASERLATTRACPQETHDYCPLGIPLSTNSV